MLCSTRMSGGKVLIVLYTAFFSVKRLHLCMCVVFHCALLFCLNESVWICGCLINQKQVSDSRPSATAHTFHSLSSPPSCSSESMTLHPNAVQPKTVTDPVFRKYHDHQCESFPRFFLYLIDRTAGYVYSSVVLHASESSYRSPRGRCGEEKLAKAGNPTNPSTFG